MSIPESLRYSEEHEWVAVAGGVATIGITDDAQEELGDIVVVELPAVGATLQRAKPLGVVESVKAVSDVYAPVAGTVTTVNAAVVDNPGLVNFDPYGAGWLVEVKLEKLQEYELLLDGAAYSETVKRKAAEP